MLVPMPPRNKSGSPEDPAPNLSAPVVRLKVILLDLVPPIWRRFQVPTNFTLRRLHVVLQHVMGWTETQKHEFRVAGQLFGMPSEDSGTVRDSRWVTLQDLLAQKTRTFHYEYGGATRWTHQIHVEGLADGNANNQRAICLAGERACPPEECGGPDAYVDLLDARHRTPFLPPSDDLDPDAFDLDAINTTLASLKF